MKAGSNHWIEMGPAATPAEQLALDRFRELLPDDGVTYAWPNVTFLSQDGRTNEVDVLLLTKQGLFVVELKGWHGTISGNQQNWQHIAPNGVRRYERNPYILTEAKAKRLAGLLKMKAPSSAQKTVPFVKALVVFHGQDSQIKLDELGQTGVFALDGYSVKGLHGKSFSDFLKAPVLDEKALVDLQRCKQIRALLEASGLKPTPKTRFVGQYSIDKADPLGEGPSWQDLKAGHPDLPGVYRRIRLFDIAPGSSAAARAEIEQSARREVKMTQGIVHEGIVTPMEFLNDAAGPALVFSYDDGEQSLEDFLVSDGASLGFDDRLNLIRNIGETLRFAHRRHLRHRTLTPKQVFVRRGGTSLRTKIRDWYTGSKSRSTATATATYTMTSMGTQAPKDLISQGSWTYLAPETLRGGQDLPDVPLDVYGLGALAYLILGSKAPAATMAELEKTLSEQGGLSLASHNDIAEPFVDVVYNATRAVESDRTASIDIFLQQLDEAIEKFTAPEPGEKPVAPNPLDAGRGSIIGDRFEVKARRGSGSTGVAFEVDDYATEREGVILKVAKDDSAASRLRVEAEVIQALDSPRIVKLIEGPIHVDGKTALILSDAGAETLASRIEAEGRATIEQLESYASDLFDAVAHLDAAGIFHRDIKPSNLGIKRDSKTRKPRLVLFDLSLAREPLTAIDSGTRGYLDPFLGQGRRRQYDKAAELYSVAVTLFEMATATMPWWSEGDASPASATDTVVVADSLFEASVAKNLGQFFTKALNPDSLKRFPDLESLALAWRENFKNLAGPSGEEEPDNPSLDRLAEAATLDTPLPQSGLSARALSAASRLDVSTVGELLGTSPMIINSIRGQGEQTRKEIQRRIRAWRSRLLSAGTTGHQHRQPAGEDRSIETLLQSLVPTPTKVNAADVFTQRLLLGIPTARPSGALDDLVVTDTHWPTVKDLANEVGVTSSRISQLVDGAAKRWSGRKDLPAVVDEISEIISAEGGVAELSEVAAALLARHGSSAIGSGRARLAAGLVRAAYETDLRSTDPQLYIRRDRQTGRVVVAAMAAVEKFRLDPDHLLDYAQQLGSKADELVMVVKDAEIPLVAGATARSALRSIEDHGLSLTDERIIRLAVAASSRTALSGRGELYEVSLPAEEAVVIALREAVVRELSEPGLRRRVTSRFPLITEIPKRPGLDKLVQRALPDMRWDQNRYTVVDKHGQTSVAGSSTYTFIASGSVSELERRLRDSLDRKSALTLAAHPRDYLKAASTLAQRFGVKRIDIAAEVLRVIKSTARQADVSWELVLRSDSEPKSSGDFTNLTRLAQAAIRPMWGEMMQVPGPVLLTNIGPLIRYGFGPDVSKLLDLSHQRPAARWILAHRRGYDETPKVDGKPVPMGPDGWIDMPRNLSDLLTTNDLNSSRKETA
ncbi:BREX system serine/threonine kinase PglW [Arthrobacter sp. Marseille-P9274]|uniref:BREX system serine/threonine kinase PglW n=1 Tax=Arthrobacter sp. Marseille-P9274 TaxID=2866572 RepID=UPI0021C71476|nr:BREX system serine/threonine kinase PglW [Arthrobacter sp. Marseille-P9274]